jgi:hypothetical protein
MAIAQILKATTEVKDGTWPNWPVTYVRLNARPPRCAADVKRCGGSKVFVIFYPYRVRCRD